MDILSFMIFIYILFSIFLALLLLYIVFKFEYILQYVRSNRSFILNLIILLCIILMLIYRILYLSNHIFQMDILKKYLPLFLLIEFCTIVISLILFIIFIMTIIYNKYFCTEDNFIGVLLNYIKISTFYKRVFIINFTVFNGIPFMILFKKKKIFLILRIVLFTFLIWVFSLEFLLIVYWSLSSYLMIEAIFLYLFTTTDSKLFGHIFSYEDKKFSKQYFSYFYGDDFKSKCKIKILEFLFYFLVFFILYLLEAIEREEVHKFVINYIESNPGILSFSVDSNDSLSQDMIYSKNYNQIYTNFVLSKTVLLRNKLLIKSFLIKLYSYLVKGALF